MIFSISNKEYELESQLSLSFPPRNKTLVLHKIDFTEDRKILTEVRRLKNEAKSAIHKMTRTNYRRAESAVRRYVQYINDITEEYQKLVPQVEKVEQVQQKWARMIQSDSRLSSTETKTLHNKLRTYHSAIYADIRRTFSEIDNNAYLIEFMRAEELDNKMNELFTDSINRTRRESDQRVQEKRRTEELELARIKEKEIEEQNRDRAAERRKMEEEYLQKVIADKEKLLEDSRQMEQKLNDRMAEYELKYQKKMQELLNREDQLDDMLSKRDRAVYDSFVKDKDDIINQEAEERVKSILKNLGIKV